MLNLRKDPTDRRTTRLHLTEASLNFWRETEADGMAFMSDLYEGIPTSAFQAVRPMLLTLMNNLDRMDVQSRITSSDVLEEENQ
jgi:DNA-binding MarR family transcriptional regulator